MGLVNEEAEIIFPNLIHVEHTSTQPVTSINLLTWEEIGFWWPSLWSAFWRQTFILSCFPDSEAGTTCPETAARAPTAAWRASRGPRARTQPRFPSWSGSSTYVSQSWGPRSGCWRKTSSWTTARGKSAAGKGTRLCLIKCLLRGMIVKSALKSYTSI